MKKLLIIILSVSAFSCTSIVDVFNRGSYPGQDMNGILSIAITSPSNTQQLPQDFSISGSYFSRHGAVSVTIQVQGPDGFMLTQAAAVSPSNFGTAVRIEPYGSYTLSAIIKDQAGFTVTSAPLPVSVVTLDTLVYMASTNVFEGSVLSNSNWNISGVLAVQNDTNPKVLYSLNGDVWKPVTSNSYTNFDLILKGLSQTNHTLQIMTIASWGLTNTTPVMNFLVDWTSPAIAVNNPSNGHIISNAAVSCDGTAMDALSGLEGIYAAADGGTYERVMGLSNWMHSINLPEGNHVISFYAQDFAYNRSAVISRNVTIYGDSVYVATNGSDANNGTIVDPVLSIDRAVKIALTNNFSQIKVQGGSYFTGKGLLAGDYGFSLSNRSGMIIRGGWNHDFTSITGVSILNATNNARHIAYLSNVSYLTMSGFHFVKGLANGGADPHRSGAGILAYDLDDSSLTNMSFISNNALNNAGGIMIVRGRNLVLSNLVFLSNKSAGSGGGISLSYASNFIIDAWLQQNEGKCGGGLNLYASVDGVVTGSAWSNVARYLSGGGNGGGYSLSSCTNVRVNVSAWSNITSGLSTPGTTTGGGEGGAVYMDYGLTNYITGNFIGNSGRYGGAVYIYGGYSNVTEGYFFSNRSYQIGGGVFYNNSTWNIVTNSRFEWNISDNLYGGAVGFERGYAALNTSYLSNNGRNSAFYSIKISNLVIANNWFLDQSNFSIYMLMDNRTYEYKDLVIQSNKFGTAATTNTIVMMPIGEAWTGNPVNLNYDISPTNYILADNVFVTNRMIYLYYNSNAIYKVTNTNIHQLNTNSLAWTGATFASNNIATNE